MAKKVFNKQGGLHSDAAYTALENRMWGSSVANAASFVVTPGAGMNITISIGDGLISVDAFNARRIQVTAAETVAVSGSNATYNRIDSIVAYIDTTVVASTAQVDNTNDMLKFMAVPGTAAATPLPPTGAAIQSAISAGNPYMVLYDLLLPQGATNVAGITLTDRRKVITDVVDGSVTTNKLGALAVTDPKIGPLALKFPKIDTSTFTTGKFYAYNNNTNQAIPNTTFTDVVFNATTINPDNWYNTATNRFTPQIAGYYYVGGFVGLLSVGDQGTIHVQPRISGSGIGWTRIKQSGSGELGGYAGTIAYFNGTTDYATLATFTTGGATNIGGSVSNTYFYGYRVL